MSNVGGVMIAIQSAISNADFRSDNERSEFCQHLVKTMDENVRQKLLTWRANRIREDNEPKAEPVELEVPDHLRREFARKRPM